MRVRCQHCKHRFDVGGGAVSERSVEMALPGIEHMMIDLSGGGKTRHIHVSKLPLGANRFVLIHVIVLAAATITTVAMMAIGTWFSVAIIGTFTIIIGLITANLALPIEQVWIEGDHLILERRWNQVVRTRRIRVSQIQGVVTEPLGRLSAGTGPIDFGTGRISAAKICYGKRKLLFAHGYPYDAIDWLARHLDQGLRMRKRRAPHDG